MPHKPPILVSTLGDRLAHGHSMWVHCRAWACGQEAAIDLAALAERLGADHDAGADALRRYFRCSRCGARDAGFTVSGYDARRFGGGWR